MLFYLYDYPLKRSDHTFFNLNISSSFSTGSTLSLILMRKKAKKLICKRLFVRSLRPQNFYTTDSPTGGWGWLRPASEKHFQAKSKFFSQISSKHWLIVSTLERRRTRKQQRRYVDKLLKSVDKVRVSLLVEFLLSTTMNGRQMFDLARKSIFQMKKKFLTMVIYFFYLKIFIIIWKTFKKSNTLSQTRL